MLKKLHAAHMATGIVPEEEFIRCPWLQPAATLCKPCSIEQLLGTVREVLRATDRLDQPDPPDRNERAI